MNQHTDREWPKAIAAEKAALGWAMQDPAAAAILVDRLRPSDYFLAAHRMIHAAIARLVAQGRPTAREIVAEDLGDKLAAAGGGVALFDLTELVASGYGFEDYITTVKKKSAMRRIIEQCEATVAKARTNHTDPGDLTADLWESLRDLDEARPVPGPVLVRLSDVAAEAVTWLWPGYLPLGKQTNVMGDPGLGKSYLALDIVSRVTRGGAMPDGSAGRGGTVLYLTAEDGLGDTVRPRVDRLGGDPSKVMVLTGVGWKDRTQAFNLDADLPMLEAAVLQTSPVLLVVDPLSAYLGKTDSHRDADVRGRLAPLAQMAEVHRFAVLSILHMNKSDQQKAIYRASGALAFVAAARANFGVAEDPEDTAEGFGRKRKLFVPLKINLGPFPPQLAYRIDAEGLHWDEAPVTSLDANAVMAGEKNTTDTAERKDAESFLRQVLAAGPLAGGDVKREAKEAMVPWRQVERGKINLGIRVYKEGYQGHWLWSLPA